MNRIPDRKWLKSLMKDLVYAVIGSFLIAFALTVFNAPNDIAPGGATGLATALAAVTPIRVSLWSIIINVPLLICAWRMLGIYPLIMTIVSTFLLSGFIELCSFIPTYTNNVLMASIFGGAITGLGVGIMFLRGISTGGTDLLALILRRIFPNIPNGTLLLGLDGAVVVVAVIVFKDIEVALYSVIGIIIGSKVIDALAEGVDYAKVIYIVTENGEAVSKILNSRTERGTTVLPAKGGFTGVEKQMIITVTRRTVLSQTLRLIKAADPDAFCFVMDSTEVHGEGFKRELF